MDGNGPNVIEHAHPTMSRASFEGWPLRWKVAAIMVLPVLLAATFGALRIQNELSAASKLSVASGNAGIVVPAVEFVDRLDNLAYSAASGAPLADNAAGAGRRPGFRQFRRAADQGGQSRRRGSGGDRSAHPADAGR